MLLYINTKIKLRQNTFNCITNKVIETHIISILLFILKFFRMLHI
uniref:Uncharacterized protein n=1 Tax=Anguilla anguilla TaxID=7936 RepID=A0A0E9TVZ9_ANGAN